MFPGLRSEMMDKLFEGREKKGVLGKKKEKYKFLHVLEDLVQREEILSYDVDIQLK